MTLQSPLFRRLLEKIDYWLLNLSTIEIEIILVNFLLLELLLSLAGWLAW